MRSCSVRVKKLLKVGFSEGAGVQLDFFLKGGFCHECYCVSMRVLNYSRIYLYLA